jgi:hypothetical protein
MPILRIMCRRRRPHLAASALAALLALALTACGPGDPPANYFFFTLTQGTPVDIELTGTSAPPDASVSMSINGTTLAMAGDRALLGVAVDGIHVHPEWLAAIPGGPPPADLAFTLSFRLLSTVTQYEPSDAYTLHFTLAGSAPTEPDEAEVLIGSSRSGGGQLVARYAFADPIPLYFDQCLGGSGDDCSGGLALYRASDPGFAPRE